MTRDFFRCRAALACARAAVLALACALACGCASMRPGQAAERPLTPQAQATYDYLEFQTYLQGMQRTLLQSRTSPEAFTRALEYQKAAAQAMDRVLTRQDAPALYMEKASLFWNPEQIGEAREILQKGLARHPEDLDLNVAVANTYITENNSVGAAETLKAFLLRREDRAVRERLAQLLNDAGQAAEALEVVKRIPAGERSADVLYQMARAEARLGQRKAAIESLKKLVRQNPDHLDAWVELAYQQELEKDYTAALGTYSKLLAMGDQRDDIRQRIENGGGEGRDDIRQRVVSLLLKLNNPDKALQTALAGSHGKAFVLSAALIFLNEGFSAQASTLLDVLASEPPIPGEYYFYKAVIANDGEQNPEKALSFLDLVSESDPNYSQALQFRIQLLYTLGREPEALRLMEQGTALFPGQTRFPLLMVGYLMDKKRFVEARAVLEQAIAGRPDDEELQYQYGAVLDRSGDRAQALAIMQRIVDKNPEHADALNYIGYSLVEENRDLERALGLIKKADKLKPENGFIVDSLAWAYFRLGRLDEAFKHISRAVALVLEDPTMWEHYGDIARAMGKKAKAATAYKNALKYKHEEPARIEKKLKGL